MSRYTVYVRTEEGYILRMNNVVYGSHHAMEDSWRATTPYIHEEPLEGFPESVVRWAASAGAAVGIAPLALHPGEH
jgi:hypothetical protein